MKNFDTILFGYGLTLNILNEINKRFKISQPVKENLGFNNYLHDILFKDDHSFLWRDFTKRFNESKLDNIKARIESKVLLQDRYEEICEYGFERWVSKFLFDKERPVDNNLRMFVYFLYNHHADILWRQVFYREDVKKLFYEISENILKIVNNEIYTTNYDIFLDEFIKIKHIHGKFILPMNKFNEVVTPMKNNVNQIEYSYLFGGGGIEKYNRILDITKMDINEYDLDFFNNDNLDFGTLLIYGLSFAKTEYITEELLEKFPKYKEDYFFLSIDGHILNKLKEKMVSKKLKKIFITYYKKEEKEYLEKLFSMAKLDKITEFIESTDVKLIETI